MAKEKKAKTTKKGLIDDAQTLEEATTIESTLDLHEIKLKELSWYAKVTIAGRLEQTQRLYQAVLQLDEQPDLDKIAGIERDLADGLFKEDAVAGKNAKKQIERIEKTLDEKRALCERIEMLVQVFELKYTDKGTQMVVLIPDAAIEALNRQKGRLKLYRVSLVPKFV